MKWVEEISASKPVKEDDLITLCQLPDASSTTHQLYTTLRTHLLKLQDSPVLPFITMMTKKRTLDELFSICRNTDTAEVRMYVNMKISMSSKLVNGKRYIMYSQVDVALCWLLFIQTTASLLHAVMVSEIRSTFYKINVHAALTPEKIWGYLKPAIDQANKLKEAFKGPVGQEMSLHLPFVTVSVDFSTDHLHYFVMLTLQVFLDEVNTSSCLGLFKEIILDGTFDGVVYTNMYIIV